MIQYINIIIDAYLCKTALPSSEVAGPLTTSKGLIGTKSPMISDVELERYPCLQLDTVDCAVLEIVEATSMEHSPE